MKILFSQSEPANHATTTLAIDTASDIDTSEECSITTPDGLSITINKGKKKKAQVLSKLVEYCKTFWSFLTLIFNWRHTQNPI